MTNNKRSVFLYLTIALSMLLASCDGGLFGTGDGNNNDMMIDNSPGGSGTIGENTGGTTGDTTGGTTGGATGDTTGGEETGETTANQADVQHSVATFDNMMPGGEGSLPQLRVLNLTNVNVQVAVNEIVEPLVANLQPDQDSGRVNLPVDSTKLLFSNTSVTGVDTAAVVHTIDPFNAAEFTITTAIVRRKLDNTIGVIALATQAKPTSPTAALVRIVQNSTLGDASRSATITLLAIEPDSSGANTSFEGLSYVAPVTAYADVVPGSYTLSDAGNRFANENIIIEAGRVYTLVINSDVAPALRVINDSQ